MTVANKAIALLGHLQPADVRGLPPAQRRHFAQMCRHLADQADPPARPEREGESPRSGVLMALANGQRGD